MALASAGRQAWGGVQWEARVGALGGLGLTKLWSGAASSAGRGLGFSLPYMGWGKPQPR